MPKGVIDTKAKEKKWKKAKEIAAEQGKADRWPLVMHIFKQMGGLSKEDQDTNIKIERALASQGRKTAIPQEAHEALHAWWQQNKEKMLTSKQKKALSDIQGVKQRRAGIKLVKSDYIEEMYKALLAVRNELSENLNKAKKPSSDVEWSQSPDHTPKELELIANLVNQGYHPREAAHLISPTRGGRGEHRDYTKALKSNVAPTQLSDKMFGDLKTVADQWLRMRDRTAKFSPEKNPVKYAVSEAAKTHKSHADKFNDAYKSFLDSPEMKAKKGVDRMDAIDAWKEDWHSKNPEHATSAHEASSKASGAFKQAKEARKQYLKDVGEQLVSGGGAAELSSAAEELDEPSQKLSIRGAAEHVGGYEGDDDDRPSVSISTDPYTKFASAHKQYVQSILKPKAEQAKQQTPAQPEVKPEAVKQQEPKAPEPAVSAPEQPKTIIRRIAKPDQLERMKNVDAAKMALQTKKD